MQLVIFEDDRYDQLYPMSLTRPVFELKCGINSLQEKINGYYASDKTAYFIRDHLVPTFKKKLVSGETVNDIKAIRNEETLIINGRCLLLRQIPEFETNDAWGEKDGDFIFARVSKETLGKFRGNDFNELISYLESKLRKISTDCLTVNYPWELINHNAESIVHDFNRIGKNEIKGSIDRAAVIFGSKNQIYVAEGVEIHPMVCLDTRNGPIIIDEGAEIQPFTRIEGPAYIGRGTIILAAKVREGCSIGPNCRIGGEIEESIFHAYSNKYHDGFIGHSYVGEWVNLGASTNNSDLKNDYSEVHVVVKGTLTNSGNMKVGSFIGDHTKTSIGTLMNTGTHIGALCIIASPAGLLPKYIPSCTWFINNLATKRFGFKKLLEIVRVSMERRKVQLTEEDIELLKTVYEIAKPDRDILIEKTAYRI